jgi:hypothetical protein
VNVIEQKAAIGQKDKLFLKYKVTTGSTLDKEATSHDDLMDAFRMSPIFWH